jgi:glycolate oxidase FAD binding subunit
MPGGEAATMEGEPAGGLPEERPASGEEAAGLLAACAHEGRRVRFRGGTTKLGWGNPVQADVALSTAALDQIVEHNPGDLTAVLQAGVRLADAQAAFAAAGQQLMLDPPLGHGNGATVGGIVATADAGPLRHRYGPARDLVLGVTLALPDGTLARAGGKVIKNVAGYDLAKLSTGAYGTLGLVVQVAVRLHPVPERTASVAAEGDDPDALGAAVARLAVAPLEDEALDVAWREGHGGVIARYGGPAAPEHARDAARLLGDGGLAVRIVEEDEEPWAQQRTAQRASDGAIVRVSALPDQLPRLLRAADGHGAALVARAAFGTSWIRLASAADDELAAAVRALREALAPAPCVVLDAPEAVRAAVDPWGAQDRGVLALSRRLKERFDPDRTCNPGVFVGGI